MLRGIEHSLSVDATGIEARLSFQSEPATPRISSESERRVACGSIHRQFIDYISSVANNRSMARPEVAHRIKSYSAATGYVYQYCNVEVQRARRGFSLGTDYVYLVSVDRQERFPLVIFVRQSAVEKWSKRTGRTLTGTEEYAVAKMRLFDAFDEMPELATVKPELIVDESNLDALLEKLDL